MIEIMEEEGWVDMIEMLNNLRAIKRIQSDGCLFVMDTTNGFLVHNQLEMQKSTQKRVKTDSLKLIVLLPVIEHTCCSM